MGLNSIASCIVALCGIGIFFLTTRLGFKGTVEAMFPPTEE